MASCEGIFNMVSSQVSELRKDPSSGVLDNEIIKMYIKDDNTPISPTTADAIVEGKVQKAYMWPQGNGYASNQSGG